MTPELETRARAFLDDDLDPATRSELGALLEAARADPSGAAAAELASRFSGPLRFGTAGLRGRVEAGESRMNRATVVRATGGLADYVLEAVPEAARRGVVLGRDARRGSEAFHRDAAGVLAARGLRVHLLPEPVPTPVVAFGVRHLDAAAGVMITASHNPPADNGYKVYGPGGAQIASPVDAALTRVIDAQPGARHVPRVERLETSPLVEARPELVERYLEALDGVRHVPGAPVGALSVVYTPLHGVGARVFLEAVRRRGLTRVAVVPEQAEPDPSFPTIAFPNPEEPGALDLALARAREVDADLVLANDPDADRLAVAVRSHAGSFVVLTGDQIGLLLARHLIDHDHPSEAARAVVGTLVSSRLLARMAAAAGIRHAETLTGFKHIAARMGALEREGWRPLLGYEEALGYAVCREVHDKDGISAALVIAEMAAVAKSEGATLLDRLEAAYRAHGRFVGRTRSAALRGHDGSARIADGMRRLRAAPSAALAALGVVELWDLARGVRREVATGAERLEPEPRGDVVILELEEGGRAAVRPSGTEPKLKLYIEIEAGPGDPAVTTPDAEARVEAVATGLWALLGLEGTGRPGH